MFLTTQLLFLLLAQQEESVESPWKNNYFTTKKDIPISSQVSKQSFNSFNNIFSRHRSFVPKECLCSNSKLSNCCSDIVHQKEHWEMCRVEVVPAGCLELHVVFLGIRCMYFWIRSDLAVVACVCRCSSFWYLMILPENYMLDRVVFVPFLMLSEFELQPSGLGIKTQLIASLFHQ